MEGNFVWLRMYLPNSSAKIRSNFLKAAYSYTYDAVTLRWFSMIKGEKGYQSIILSFANLNKSCF